MNTPSTILSKGTKVQVLPKLSKPRTFQVNLAHIMARTPGAVGKIWGVVPGYGGDAYFVEHEGSVTLAAYTCEEFSLMDAAPSTVYDHL